MRLEFDPESSDRYPHGYWYAMTNDGGYDAVGPTPLDAVTSLALVMEQALYKKSEEAR